MTEEQERDCAVSLLMTATSDQHQYAWLKDTAKPMYQLSGAASSMLFTPVRAHSDTEVVMKLLAILTKGNVKTFHEDTKTMVVDVDHVMGGTWDLITDEFGLDAVAIGEVLS